MGNKDLFSEKSIVLDESKHSHSTVVVTTSYHTCCSWAGDSWVSGSASRRSWDRDKNSGVGWDEG